VNESVPPIRWRKSSHSTSEGGQCVEVADLGVGRQGIRDSKNPDAPFLDLAETEFASLLQLAKSGRLDLKR
jgi:hypothetical protein